MTFDNLDQIKQLIQHPINTEMLERAEQIREKHELHVSGIGLDDYIDKIQGIGNKNATSLYRALGKPITTSETQKIISVQNKIFSARGGGRYYEFTNDRDKQTFKEILSDVKGNMSIRAYMSKVWEHLVNTDPSGLIMTEVKDNEIFLSYKSSCSIHDIDFKSPQEIEYIIFKPEKRDKGLYYRVIDDRYDYMIHVYGSDYEIVEEETFPNYWNLVPATFISDRQDKKSTAYDSHISECMNYADGMLIDYTLYTVYKNKIGIPAQWQYERECATCDGSGMVPSKDDRNTDIKCGYCDGKGTTNHNRDISEIFILPLPEQGDVPLNPPLGYVIPDLESWSKYEETIDRESRLMYSSVWGESSVIEGDRRNITASELTVRDVSKETKLNDINDNAENVEKFITDLFGVFYFPGSYQGCIVANGRNYDLKSATELEQEYITGIEKDLPTSKLNKILENLYYTLYKNTPQKLAENLNELYTKPFFHWKPERIQKLGISNEDRFKNLYYDEFKVWYELNVEKYAFTTIDKINENLNKWIQDKIPNVEQNIEENELSRIGSQL